MLCSLFSWQKQLQKCIWVWWLVALVLLYYFHFQGHKKLSRQHSLKIFSQKMAIKNHFEVAWIRGCCGSLSNYNLNCSLQLLSVSPRCQTPTIWWSQRCLWERLTSSFKSRPRDWLLIPQCPPAAQLTPTWPPQESSSVNRHQMFGKLCLKSQEVMGGFLCAEQSIAWLYSAGPTASFFMTAIIVHGWKFDLDISVSLGLVKTHHFPSLYLLKILKNVRQSHKNHG